VLTVREITQSLMAVMLGCLFVICGDRPDHEHLNYTHVPLEIERLRRRKGDFRVTGAARS
jgi:hypothetical protein